MVSRAKALDPGASAAKAAKSATKKATKKSLAKSETTPMIEAADAPTSSIGRRRAAARDRSGAAYKKRREEIIQAAALVFRSKGYRATTLADVAEAVGGDRASLYFYISSKEEIFDEIVSDVVKSNLAVAEEIRDSKAPVTSKLRTLIVQLMEAYAEAYPFLYVYLQENLAHVSESRQPWAADLRSINRRYEAAVEAIIQQGIDEGSVRSLTDPRILAFGLLGMVSWTHRWFNPEKSAISATEIGQAYAEVMLNGLAASTHFSLPDPHRVSGGEPVRPSPHPDVVRLVEQFESAGVPTYEAVSVPKARSILEGVTKLQREPQELAVVEDLLIEGSSGLLPARVYNPAPGEALPIVVYFHGGGWALGSLRAADEPCRALAHLAKCVIVSVEYRRAPETKFPGPLEDCVSAVTWVSTHRGELGGGDRLLLMGDSAGGNLAAATASIFRDQGNSPIDGQILIYPCLAPASLTNFPSYAEYADGPLMTRREMDWFWTHYLPTPADGSNPLASPLLGDDFSNLPPTTVIVAELDPLRDEGVAYVAALREAGVTADVVNFDGAAHGFWWMDAVMCQALELNELLAGIISKK